MAQRFHHLLAFAFLLSGCGYAGAEEGGGSAVESGAGWVAWQECVFTPGQIADGTVSGMHADPDRDGVINLMEYALGGLPLEGDAAETLPRLRDGGERGPLLVFRRRPGVSTRLVVASDSFFWREFEPGAEAVGVSEHPGGLEDVEIEMAGALGDETGDAPLFARVLVALDDPGSLFPEILAASLSASGEGLFRVDVTVRSPYDTPQRYADGWRVLTPDGQELGFRHLLHDHAAEQPFTRSLSGVMIPDDVTEVIIQGRDLRFGWGGETLTAPVPR